MPTMVSLFYNMFNLPYQPEYDDLIRDELMQKLKNYCAVIGMDRPVFLDPGLSYTSQTLDVVNNRAHLISAIADQLSKSNLACFEKGYQRSLTCKWAHDIAKYCGIKIVYEEDLIYE